MKTWKLVSGILSIILFVIVSFQSCAAGIGNTLSENGEVLVEFLYRLCFWQEESSRLPLEKAERAETLR